MELDVTPEPEDIVQAEEKDYNAAPIAVSMCGPVQTRELPAVRGGYGTVTAVGTAVGVRLLPFEPRRKNAVIMAVDADIWVSSTQSGAQFGAGGSAKVTANVPFTIDNMEEVWACSTSGTTDISVITNYWSE